MAPARTAPRARSTGSPRPPGLPCDGSAPRTLYSDGHLQRPPTEEQHPMRSLSLTAACAALVVALVPAAASAQDTATLAIDGVGTALVAPDVATVSIEVRSAAATRQSARRKANARTARVLAALAAKGVTRAMLTTSGVTLTRMHVKKQIRFN